MDNKLLIVGGILAFILFSKKSEGATNTNSNNSNLPRGIRNKNPGNLILTSIPWQGKVPNSQNTDGSFEQFNTMVYGVRAMIKDLKNDIEADGDNTIYKLLMKYAPPFENPTEAYIQAIENMSGINRNTIIYPGSNNFKKIVQSIANFENYGIKPLSYTIDSNTYSSAYAII